MEVVNKVHERNLVAWAKDKPNVMVLSGDLTGSTEISLFKSTYPDRFVSMGMAEQNMLSWAGGLAREGFIPFLHTFAVFLYRRPLDQLEMSVCYPNLPVRLVGFLPGISTPGGVTHQAIEDLSVLRGIPNLTILEVGDATDVESVLDLTKNIPGPVYIRMLRGEIPRLFPKSERLEFNHARVLSVGTDVALLTTGLCTEQAMRVTSIMKNRGVSLSHLHVTTIKPFTDPTVLSALRKANRGVITMENHNVIGGLGTCTAEMMAESGIGSPLVRIGIKDTYCQGASLPYLMRKHELDSLGLVSSVERLLGEKLNITAADLAGIRPEQTAAIGAEQLEAL